VLGHGDHRGAPHLALTCIAMRGNQTVPSHRQALRAWLLSFPGLDLLN